jgi:activator of Hsp90 ATPase-like protein
MDHGTLEEAPDGRPRLRFTRRLPHPPAKVWRAITEPEHLAAWFPDAGVEPEVLAADAPRALDLRWGTDRLRFELRPDGGGTELTLLDTLDAVGKAARDGAGWHVCLEDLAHHLGGTRAEGSGPDRWRAVHPDYVAALGPAAATIGPPAGALG